MGYKITKYKGKTKIKDTKTGKSAEIDIEKFMNGGYKTISEYSLGGVGDCPDGDLECQKEKYRQLMVSGDMEAARSNSFFNEFDFSQEGRDLKNMETNKNYYQSLVDDGNFRKARTNPVTSSFFDQKDFKELQTVSTLQPKGLAPLDQYSQITAPDISGELDSKAADVNINAGQGVNRGEQDYNIPNLYAGVDIPTAAFTLGQSIKSKNTLGTVASSLKLLTGLGRNVVSGLGHQNRTNQVMKDYYEKQKNNRNPVQYFSYGGKKDEELATGEYMHGIENEETEEYNAEIEKGEYFQSNEGDIAEVVGNKHSQGGEKIQMEAEDRVLSDKLKLGGKTAKMLSSKYDLNLKAKHTYSDVLDKFRRKMKLDNLIDEEAYIMKKIGEQDKVADTTTRNFNQQVLAEKQNEIKKQKHPIEEQRKELFDELFNKQEESKPDDKNPTDEVFANGGKKKTEENCPEGYKKNVKGECEKLDKEEAEALSYVPENQSVDKNTNLFGAVTPDSFQASKDRNKWFFNHNPNFNVNDPNQVLQYQKEYNTIAKKLSAPTVTEDGKWGQQTDSIDVRKFYKTVPPEGDPIEGELVENDVKERTSGIAGAYLFPDESPLPPSALQGTIKAERRFDRVRSSEIDVEPYLQDIKDREEAQVQSLEGLSPNVRAAVLANMRANSQKSESDVRNKIDTQNIQSQERAIYTNAQIQQREENASEQDRLAYEQRQYRAQALTDNDINNYFNQLQSINKQRFMDVHNLNLINATNEDVYFDGQTFRRKNSDRDILRQIKI